MKTQKQIIIGISGASGAIFGIRMLEALHDADIHTHAIISQNAAITIAQETDYTLEQVRELASEIHSYKDLAACVSSGSYATMGMIVAPCSMRCLAEIATGVTSNLISRSAEVTLKERRRLVLLARETPLTAIHLHNMQQATLAGAIIAPPVPAFYHRPQTLDDMINHTVGRVLDLFEIPNIKAGRWRGPQPLKNISQ
jgi:flavin prenyltransferase